MKHTIFAVLFAVMMTISSHARADVFTEFPRMGTFTVSDGTVIQTPSYLNDYDHLALIGVANLATLQAAMAGQGVDPVPVGPGLGLVAVFGFHYRSTDFGAYNEIIVSILSTPRDVANPRTSYYVHDIRVTKQFPLLVGRELLGLPKQRAHVKYHVNFDDDDADVDFDGDVTHSDMLFDFAEKTGLEATRQTLTMVCAGCGAFPTFPFRNDFDVVSPLEIKRVWSRIVSEGQSAFRDYNPMIDQLTINSASPVGSFLTQAQFYPTTWYIGRHIKAIDAVYP